MPPRSGKERKSYLQFCPVARALDLVGDRWTILIIRELLGGPARFNDLHLGLPGIAKNLLTTRLRHLEHDGVIRRSSAYYALTEAGASIRPIIEQLGFWGTQFPPIARPVHKRSPRASAMALEAILTRATEHMPEQRTVVEVETEAGHLEFVLGPRPQVRVQPAAEADARLSAPSRAIDDYLHGRGLDRRAFAYAAGDREARAALLAALASRA